MTTGELEYVAGFQYECVDCHTTYPMNHDIKVKEKASCNGHKISLCPWCRPDSKPWLAGRGI